MTRHRGPVLFGLLAAAIVGIVAAIIVAPRIQRSRHVERVREKVTSPDQATRGEGWEEVGDSWSEAELVLLNEAILQSGDDAIRDAALHGFEPFTEHARFAEAIANTHPHRALQWFEAANATPFGDWDTTSRMLLASDVRTSALESIVAATPPEQYPELAIFLEDIPESFQRTRGVLSAIATDIPVVSSTRDNINRDDIATYRKIIASKRTDIGIRRRAAWQLEELDDGAALGLLAPAPADEDNTVYMTALIAEKHLSDRAAAALVERWLTDFEVDRRRAAAVLAALRGHDPTKIVEAEARETDPTARRTLRMALLAMGAWPIPEIKPEEYAARTMRLSDGRLDPDTALLRMLTGDPQALSALSTYPELPSQELSEEDEQRWQRAIQWRQWSLARMVPAWQKLLNEDTQDNAADFFTRLDMLEALRLTQDEHLLWEEPIRTWRWVARTAPEKDHTDP